MTFAIGSLVKARGREWVVLPGSSEDLLLLRPLGGLEAEETGIYLPLEPVEPARFDLPDPAAVGDHRSAALLRSAVSLSSRAGTGPFRSFARIGVEPRPYQLVPLLMALRLDPVRLLIADDVGIGKTVEACLIARELLDRGEVRRLAVLCPPHLAEQWQGELREKFHLDAELVLSSTAGRLERDLVMDRSLFEVYPHVVVSMDFVKSDRRRSEFIRTAPELVIVDEAHTCAFGFERRGGRHQRHDLVKALAADESRHLILVTATPHSGKEESFRSLLRFLRPEFGDLPEDLAGPRNEPHRRRLAAHFVQRRRADIRRYLRTDTPFPERKEAEAAYRLSPEYRRLFERVLRYARETVADPQGGRHRQRVRWWSALALLRSLASSPAAAAATLRTRSAAVGAETPEEADEAGRRAVLDVESEDLDEGIDVAPGSDPTVEDPRAEPEGEEDGGEDSQARSTRKRLLELAREAEALEGEKDRKLMTALDLVKELLRDGHRPILFCRFIPTADYVARELARRLKDVEVASVTGVLPPSDREKRVEELSASPRRILVATDCLYLEHYSTARLRRLAERTRGTAHPDLFRGLQVVMEGLGKDEGCPALGLPSLGSFLWSRDALPGLAGLDLENRSLLAALHALAFARKEGIQRAVDYRNLGSEELGSVYESLLELHPQVDLEAAEFRLEAVSGHERKTTGSYYTPRSLIQCLLDSALEPVLDEAARRPDPERAILSLKVLDPACGSGHFLIAAAHRIAKRLAAARTGDEEPSPEALRRALRDVIGRSIHGVDLNPMAVELCKVSLWMEALEPGKPLSFLEHRVLYGNSLLGATPALLAKGIPDEAFEPIEGDDRKLASSFKRQNREERKGGQKTLFADFAGRPSEGAGTLAKEVEGLDAIEDVSIRGIREKEERHRLIAQSRAFQGAKLLADAWCASFVWKKTKDAPPPVTQDLYRRLREDSSSAPPATRKEIERLALEYQLFHWHLAFPDVFRIAPEGERAENEEAGWSGGFDVVLGNPPWEHVELKEKEWFATRSPAIAKAITGAIRKDLITRLSSEDPRLLEAFLAARRTHEGIAHLVGNSGRFPLCGRGRINTYAIFAEIMRVLISPLGRVGAILPSGIATDDTTKHFFQSLMEGKALASLYDFENRQGLFPAVDSRMKFSLITLTGSRRPATKGAEFVFFAQRVSDLAEAERRFALSAADIALLNPNTRTCPVFRSKRDAEITKAIYRRVPVLLKEGPPEENPWRISFKQGLFNMTSDSGLFHTRDQLDPVFRKGEQRWLPLYEAKLIHHFDHRWATYDGLETRDLPAAEKEDPGARALPRYWVPEAEVEARLAGKWDRGWLLGWRDITNTTNERTVIASVLPRVGVGHTCPLMLFEAPSIPSVAALQASFSAFAFDFVARQKIGGTHLTYGYLNQLPVLPPPVYSSPAPWISGKTFADWLLPRVLELTYTAWDLEPFALDCGYEGPPFRWDDERRSLLRAEIDAAFFHLYGISRVDADYILDTFPIVKRHDEARHGEYRTKRVILERYEAMERGIASGKPYETVLDPPAADPRVAHPPLEARPLPAAARAARPLPFRRVDRPREADKYRTLAPLLDLRAAAGAFSEGQDPEFEAWVEVQGARTLKRGMFVARVEGRSMEPRIPDGSYCLFQYPVTGTRQGRILLVQHHAIHDPETGGSFTLKRYRSTKAASEDGGWRHAEVRLEPLNPDFSPLVIPEADGDEVRPIAEFLEVLQ